MPFDATLPLGLETLEQEQKVTQEDRPIEPRRMRGVVKWFDPKKGFGFILPNDGGADVLLHANVLRNFGQSTVADGAEVEVDVLDTERGQQAVEVFEIVPPEGAGDLAAEMPDGEILGDVEGLDLEPARIKWFDKGKGFGFANVFGSDEDVFIHIEVLRRSGMADLQAGEAICIATREGQRGRMAVLVKSWDSVVGLEIE